MRQQRQGLGKRERFERFREPVLTLQRCQTVKSRCGRKRGARPSWSVAAAARIEKRAPASLSVAWPIIDQSIDSATPQVVVGRFALRHSGSSPTRFESICADRRTALTSSAVRKGTRRRRLAVSEAMRGAPEERIGSLVGRDARRTSRWPFAIARCHPKGPHLKQRPTRARAVPPEDASPRLDFCRGPTNGAKPRTWPGDPYGTRTRVFAVRGRRPGPLDEGAATAGAGEERRIWARGECCQGVGGQGPGAAGAIAPCAAIRVKR